MRDNTTETMIRIPGSSQPHLPFTFLFVINPIFILGEGSFNFSFSFWTSPERGGGVLFLQSKIEERPNFWAFWSPELNGGGTSVKTRVQKTRQGAKKQFWTEEN